MPQAPLPFGEWRPDIALLDSQFVTEAENVFAGINSYKPMPSLLPFTASVLPPPVVGLTYARASTGQWKIYAGTRTRLYSFSLAGWTDVSRTVGGNYNVPPGELWSFAQFGRNLVAVNIGDAPQVIDVDSGSNFAALAGSPPPAHSVKQIGDFLVLTGLLSNRRQIQWCSINDITAWNVGINLCDTQEFPDGGPVQGLAGNEVGYVLQDRSIRSMQFMPGDTTYIFSFSRIIKEKGAVGEFSFGTVADVLYFLAEDGFYATVGPQITPIGQDKVNEWFRANSDHDRWPLVQGIAFPDHPRVAWAFHNSSASQTYDRLIIYDWSNQKWTHATIPAQIWAALGSVGLDLDTTGTEPGDVSLDSSAQSLDSFAYIGGRPLAAGVDPAGLLGSLSGPSLRAVIETTEAHLASPASRAFVSNAYPLVDAVPETVTAGTRERLQDQIEWDADIPLEITGSASVLSSARLHRFRVTMPAGAAWTHAQGVLPDAQPDGAA